MRYDPDRQHRQSIRLSHYDYSRVGAYFLTICVHDRESLLGQVENGKVVLNRAGRAVEWTWADLPRHYSHAIVDELVVMPNHVHGIVRLEELPPDSDVPRRHALPEIVRAFKSYSARRINKGRHTPGHPVWQRNYHERVIRDEEEMLRVRQYIRDNPLRWDIDPENPASFSDRAARFS
jgi:REP element-mobilizing transposase RayT